MSIKNVCSLGTLCHTATLLKRNKLKLVSYPFDWVLSRIDIVEDCLQNDFLNFLDKKYLVSIDEKKCDHTYYYTPESNTHMFYHHNPTKQCDLEYYNRCIERFRSLLKSKEEKLFIITYVNFTYKINNEFILKIKKLNSLLNLHTTNSKLLCIVNYLNKEKNSYTITKFDNLDILEIDTISESNGSEFVDKVDNDYLDKIICDLYKFELVSPPINQPLKQYYC